MADCIRSGRRESFTVLYNSMITDRRLSLKAKGLFAVMMSRPDDWEFSVSGLAVFVGVGKDTIRSTLEELEEVGYLIRSQAHDAGGKFAGNVYVLRDTAPPLSENTDDGENRQREDPSSENPTQQKKEYNERKTNNTPIPPEGDLCDKLFERFWNAYPKVRRQKKKDARRAWKKLKPSLELCRQMAVALEAQKRSEEWTRDGGRYIPMPATWIRGERWTDEITVPPPDRPPESWEDRFGWK